MRRRDQASLALGSAALVTSVLVVGGALRWTQAIVAFLMAGALGLQVFARRRLDRASPIIVLFGTAAALTALQLLPLPSGVLDALDSVGNHLRNDGAVIAGTHPWHSISLDPSGSLRALTFFITLTAVAALSLRFAAAERGRFALLAGVAITCGLAAAVTGIHTLVNADSLYGLYTPLHTTDTPIMGPLLNPNHMGGLMAIGAVLSLGLAFYERQPTQLRVVWVVVGLTCVVMTALSLSRGAVLGMVLGLLTAAVLLVARRFANDKDRGHRGLRRDVPMAMVVALGVGVALYLSAGTVAAQLRGTSISEFNKPISKYEAWKASTKLVRESPWVGIGRGAVETNLTRVHPASAYFTFSHLENEYVSAVVEWGIPGALILAALFAWCILVATRRWRDGPLAAAGLGALAMISFQSSVDFGVELLGLAVPVTIIASTVQLAPLRPMTSFTAARVLRGLMVLGLIASGLVLLSPATTSVQEDHDAILAVDERDMSMVRASIERHPLDYFGFGVGADIATRNGDTHAIDYLNQALRLHPTHPGLHRLAARMLVGLKKYSQAAVEYSLTLEAEPTPRELLSEIATLIPNADDAAAGIPADYPALDVMLHSLSDLKRNDLAEKWLVRVADRPQHDLHVIDLLYTMAMNRNDLDVAKQTAELRLRVSHTTTSRLMLAKVQFARHELDALLTELADVTRWNGRTDEKAQAWLILCDVHIEKKEWDPALECIHRLDASGLLGGSRYDVTKRLDAINEERTRESKMKAIEELEKSVNEKKH